MAGYGYCGTVYQAAAYTAMLLFSFPIKYPDTMLMDTLCIEIHIGFVWMGNYVLWFSKTVNEIWIRDSLDAILKGKDVLHMPLILCCVS